MALLTSGVVLGRETAGTFTGLAQASAHRSPTRPEHIASFHVPASQPWTDTHVRLGAGQLFTVTAAGKVDWASKRRASAVGYRFSAGMCAGAQYTSRVGSFVAPGLNCWSVIGRIGAVGVIFFVGDTFRLKSPVAGELYLGFNDNYFGDNSGHFNVTVTTS